MSKPKVIYGGTFGPPTRAHVRVVEWLVREGYAPVIVPSIGHEQKPETVVSYLDRRHMVRLAFPSVGPDSPYTVQRAEEQVMPFVGMPVMAIDVLRYVRNRWGAAPSFAIGPDIDPTKWTGYTEIMEEGFTFVRVPSLSPLRATAVRAMIAAGDPEWEDRVANAAVAEYIKRRGLYGAPKPERQWKAVK